jgi:uncharacterized protein (DUF1810 family)
MPADPHNLQRFVEAQASVYSQALDELKAGRKRSHWMWFIFPQLRGLGHSTMAHQYGIATRAEAEAYLEHPLLDRRLQECTRAVNAVEGRSAYEIFGSPDDLKFRSSMTLFANVTADNREFVEALNRYYAGEGDGHTLALL